MQGAPRTVAGVPVELACFSLKRLLHGRGVVSLGRARAVGTGAARQQPGGGDGAVAGWAAHSGRRASGARVPLALAPSTRMRRGHTRPRSRVGDEGLCDSSLQEVKGWMPAVRAANAVEGPRKSVSALVERLRTLLNLSPQDEKKSHSALLAVRGGAGLSDGSQQERTREN